MNYFNLLRSLANYTNYDAYDKIVREFKIDQLPRDQNRETKLLVTAMPRYLRSELACHSNAVNLAAHQTSISEKDLDKFYNQINDLTPRLWFFKEYYRDFTNNLNRLNPKAKSGNLDLVVLQQILQDPKRPTKFWSVLLFHLKYKYQLTSRIYKWFRTNSRPHNRNVILTKSPLH